MTQIATTKTEMSQFVTHINSTLGKLFDRLGWLRSTVAELWGNKYSEIDKLSVSELRLIDSLIIDLLKAEELQLDGAGVVFAPGRIVGKDMHLEWWCKGKGQDICPLKLNFDRRSDRFYDYEKMPWYTQARHSGQACASGPFVDLHGTEEYIIAFSVPIFYQETFLGVAAADIKLKSLEPILVSGLMRMNNEAMVLNSEGRVLAANTPTFMVGDLVSISEHSVSSNACLVSRGASILWTVVERSASRSIAS